MYIYTTAKSKTILGIVKSLLSDRYSLFVTLNHTKLKAGQLNVIIMSLKKFYFEISNHV